MNEQINELICLRAHHWLQMDLYVYKYLIKLTRLSFKLEAMLESAETPQIFKICGYVVKIKDLLKSKGPRVNTVIWFEFNGSTYKLTPFNWKYIVDQCSHIINDVSPLKHNFQLVDIKALYKWEQHLYLHFREMKTEMQRSEKTCLKSPNGLMGDKGTEPRSQVATWHSVH